MPQVLGMTTQDADDVRWSQEAFHLPGVVESVVRCQTNGPLMATAAQLWIKPNDLVVDVTYGRGNFWTHYRPGRLVAHDLILDGVDFRQLDATVDVVVFDPPYIPQGGRDTSTCPQFIDRYGLREAPKPRRELEELIAAGMKEASRVLKPGGRLWVKCMDYISSRQYCAGRHFVVTTALELGLRQVDEFVHHSGLGPQPARAVQEHSRRAHSFLCIFQVPKRRARRTRIDGSAHYYGDTCLGGHGELADIEARDENP